MKLSLLISLAIIGLALMLYLRPWTRPAGEDRSGPPPTERFTRQCATVFSDRARPEEYCGCLWRKGVRSPGETLTTPSGRAAASACE